MKINATHPCPSCGSPCSLTPYTHTIRRGTRTVTLDWHQFVCPHDCLGEDGAPLSFVTEAVGESDRAAAEAAWREKYGEALPPPGRAGRPPRAGTPSSERVPVKFTREELDEIDRRRGDLSRSAFVRLATLGHR